MSCGHSCHVYLSATLILYCKRLSLIILARGMQVGQIRVLDGRFVAIVFVNILCGEVLPCDLLCTIYSVFHLEIRAVVSSHAYSEVNELRIVHHSVRWFVQ